MQVLKQRDWETLATVSALAATPTSTNASMIVSIEIRRKRSATFPSHGWKHARQKE